MFEAFLAQKLLLNIGYKVFTLRQVFFFTLLIFYVVHLLFATILVKSGIIFLIKHDNEKNALKKVFSDSFMNELMSQRRFRISLKTIFLGIKCSLNFKQAIRSMKLILRINKKYGSFIALRATQYIAYYVKFSALLSDRRIIEEAKLSIVTSDSNPQALALMTVSRRFNIQSAFISHAPPIRPPSRLLVNAAQLYGRYSLDHYQSSFSELGKVYYWKEWENIKTVKIPENITKIGIVLSKVSKEENVLNLISSINKIYPEANIEVRFHPSLSVPDSFKNGIKGLGAKISEIKELDKASNDWDLCLGGNSTVHIKILQYGKPSFYVRDIDYGIFDMQRLIENGFITEWSKEDSFDFSHFRSAEGLKNKLEEYFLSKDGTSIGEYINENTGVL
jgi:hypothetical protein